MSLTIVIPTYNEEGCLEKVLSDLKDFSYVHNFKIIIVDDGSTDESRVIINRLIDSETVSCVHHKINKGYGAAIKTGIRSVNTRFVITIDADGQHRLPDILNLWQTIKESDADMIVGGRIYERDSTTMRGFGKSAIRFFVRFLIKVPVYDINSGMKIYRTDLAKKYIRLAPDTMAFSDVMTIVFIYFGRYVKEVPIQINKRIAGSSSINYRTGIDTLKEIMFIATVFAPYKFFSMLAGIILIITLTWGVPFIFLGKGVTSATASGILVSLLLWSLGVIAQLISGIRKDLVENSN